jgi:enamine deaminase RidA (YjgF/YER057c/UK114 family)
VTSNIRFSNPTGLSKPPGYTHVVEITGPARIVYIAGQLGLDKEGNAVGDFRAQTVQAFDNLRIALADAGAGFEHVVKINNYLVDIAANIATFREVRDRYLNTAAPPASTAVGVPGLARPGALFEIEAIAVLPAR